MAAALKEIADWTESVPAIPAILVPDLMFAALTPRRFLSVVFEILASGAQSLPSL